MAKYKDMNGLGKSKLCPKKKDELATDRHHRRKLFNSKRFTVVRDFCNEHGLRLKITNGFHHWQASKNGRVVEWWPSSAKVVIDKQWQKGIHVHDYKQFIAVLSWQRLGFIEKLRV